LRRPWQTAHDILGSLNYHDAIKKLGAESAWFIAIKLIQLLAVSLARLLVVPAAFAAMMPCEKLLPKDRSHG
jgi:hypothetical protein